MQDDPEANKEPDESLYSFNVQTNIPQNGNAMNAKDKGLTDMAMDVQRQKDAQNWESPENKANPRNWPLWNRVFHTAMPALLSFAV